MHSAFNPEDLKQEYALRFSRIADYRRRVWEVLVNRFFQPIIGRDKIILDLGCGWGEFINQIAGTRKFGLDLNPDSRTHLANDVEFLQQASSDRWSLGDGQLDVVFTSNFFEHLPTKDHLAQTVSEAHRCLKMGGILICLGPNIRYTGDAYWDFFDHHLPLTDKSLGELLRMRGFAIERCIPRFLPYTMGDGRRPPLWCVSAYLAFPPAWCFLGKQFLIVARKAS